eukprot:scaffold783_cov217-Skeletonema_menzelii.AAC.1
MSFMSSRSLPAYLYVRCETPISVERQNGDAIDRSMDRSVSEIHNKRVNDILLLPIDKDGATTT